MPPFDRVVLIYNPNSTGEAEGRARELHEELHRRLPGTDVRLLPTEHAGHATDLARETAATGSPLVVSVSGDGGYNEVVNGVMQAGNARAVSAVAAAGNANDHRRTTRERPLLEAIVEGAVSRIDLLRLSVGDSSSGPRYAHSYIGLGLTPVVAVDLEKGDKGSLKEMLTVVRAFAKFRPFEIELPDGSRQQFDSLVFANISQMAKVATLSEDEGRPDDGQFEVVMLKHTAKWRILATAAKASLRGLGRQPSVSEYRFRTVKPLPLQIDGEVVDLPASAQVRVDVARRALRTVL
jgi:diacylglycerol kinase (ATP)